MGAGQSETGRESRATGGFARLAARHLFNFSRWHTGLSILAVLAIAVLVVSSWTVITFLDSWRLVGLWEPTSAGPLWSRALEHWLGSYGLVGAASLLLLGGMTAVMMNARQRVALEAQRRDLSLAQLREREQRLHDMAEACSDWLWELGPDLRFSYVSDRVGEIAGLEPCAMLGRSHEEAFKNLLAPDADRRLFQDIRARRPFRELMLTLERAGQRRWVVISGKPLFGDDGAFLGYRGTGRDITEAHLAEARAEAAHARLVRALESSADGVALYDGAGRLVLCNQRFRELLFPRLEGLVKPGAGFRDLMTLFAKSGRCQAAARDPQGWLAALTDARKSGESRVERLATGQWIRIKDHVSPDGDWITTIGDITRYKERETELIRLAGENRRLAAAVNATEVGVVIADMRDEERPLIFVNPAFTRMTGYSAEEVIGRNCKFLQGPDSDAQTVELLGKALAEGRPIQTESRNRRKDGTPFWTRLTLDPVYGDDGKLQYFVGLQQDITEQKQAEQELRDTKEMAELASRAKSDFLATMSHELRTPLNAIIGFSDILKDSLFGPLSERYRSYAKDIHNSGLHLLELINDILDLSKAEAGRIELHLEPIDLRATIERGISMIRHRAEQGGVKLRSDLPADLPWLEADQLRLKQILINLLTNAVKFSPPGSTVTASAALEEGRLRVAVTDQGIGMAAEDIPRALEPFVQIDSALARTRQREGTGLGLPLSQRLAHMHGADFVVDSELDRGTTVTLRFPPERTLAAPDWQPPLDRVAGGMA